MFGASRPPTGGRAVVITGASSGLGRQSALHLARHGFRVFAGVREAHDGKELAAAHPQGGIRPLILDVTEPEQIAAATRRVAEELDGAPLWGLVNNAGICVPGPLECLPPESLREQLETNVIGQVSVIQSFLPLLRRGPGRIINITSGLGSIALPYFGAYVAAQFAKEGMSDTLRRELKPFGITVSVVQPGMITTPIWGKVAQSGHRLMASVATGVAEFYSGPFSRFLEVNEQQSRRSKTRPEDFAGVIAHILTTARPRTRYHVGTDMLVTKLMVRLLPDTALDRRLAPLVQAP